MPHASPDVIDVIYGLYLIPPPDVLAPLSIARAVLQREFGSRVAARFMAHVTVKGFFKPGPAADLDTLLRELDDVYAGLEAFSVHLKAPDVDRGRLGASVLLPVEQVEPLMALQQATWQAIEPYVALDCPFTPGEQPATRFRPHLTLMQYDLPTDPVLEEQAMDLCRYVTATATGVTWTARNLQFIRFTSDDWRGRWWDTLAFEQLRGWRLR
jgi:2'-5' RNA ligase